MDFWEKTNGTFGVLDIFTKHLFEKKMNFLWVYMPFKEQVLEKPDLGVWGILQL